MKRIILTIVLCMAVAMQAWSQDIYHEVKKLMDDYEQIKLDTSKNIEERKVATFKYDAIYYQIYMGSEATEHELGQQVSAMIDFLDLYFTNLQKVRTNDYKNRVRIKFKTATLENARFGDTDKETIYAYVDNDDFITNFSLDTDWVAAYDQVKKEFGQ